MYGVNKLRPGDAALEGSTPAQTPPSPSQALHAPQPLAQRAPAASGADAFAPVRTARPGQASRHPVEPQGHRQAAPASIPTPTGVRIRSRSQDRTRPPSRPAQPAEQDDGATTIPPPQDYLAQCQAVAAQNSVWLDGLAQRLRAHGPSVLMEQQHRIDSSHRIAAEISQDARALAADPQAPGAGRTHTRMQQNMRTLCHRLQELDRVASERDKADPVGLAGRYRDEVASARQQIDATAAHLHAGNRVTPEATQLIHDMHADLDVIERQASALESRPADPQLQDHIDTARAAFGRTAGKLAQLQALDAPPAPATPVDAATQAAKDDVQLAYALAEINKFQQMSQALFRSMLEHFQMLAKMQVAMGKSIVHLVS